MQILGTSRKESRKASERVRSIHISELQPRLETFAIFDLIMEAAVLRVQLTYGTLIPIFFFSLYELRVLSRVE